MLTRRFLVLSTTALLLNGCAAFSPVQVGQTAGTIAGAAAIPGLGAPIGSLVGMLVGMVVQDQIDLATETKERRELGQQLEPEKRGTQSMASDAPAPPPPVRVWVDECVERGRVLAGHFEVQHLD